MRKQCRSKGYERLLSMFPEHQPVSYSDGLISACRSERYRDGRSDLSRQEPYFPGHRREIQICDDEILAIENRLHNVGRVRHNNTTSSAFYPFVCDLMRQLARNFGGRHHETNGHHEASAFEGIVTTRELCHLVHGRPNSDMYVFSSLVHSHSRQGHPMLPANQSPYTCLTDINRLQPAAVTGPPHKAFCECGYEFGMMVCQEAIG